VTTWTSADRHRERKKERKREGEEEDPKDDQHFGNAGARPMQGH